MKEDSIMLLLVCLAAALLAFGLCSSCDKRNSQEIINLDAK